MAGLLCVHEAVAQETGTGQKTQTLAEQDSLLREDITSFTARALKDRLISREKADSIMTFIRDSIPPVHEFSVSVLMDIRDEIDSIYDDHITRINEMHSYDHQYISSSMLPTVLHEPEGLTDPYKERRMAGLAAAKRVEEDALMHFGQEKSVIPKWAIGPLRLLFNLGMDTSGRTIAIHQGLYYINIPPGKPQSESWTATIPKTTD